GAADDHRRRRRATMRDAEVDHRVEVELLERRHVEIRRVEDESLRLQQIAEPGHLLAVRRRSEAVEVEDALTPAAVHPREWYPAEASRAPRQSGSPSARRCARR